MFTEFEASGRVLEKFCGAVICQCQMQSNVVVCTMVVANQIRPNTPRDLRRRGLYLNFKILSPRSFAVTVSHYGYFFSHNIITLHV